MTLITTTPAGRALVLNALKRARQWRNLEAHKLLRARKYVPNPEGDA